MGQGFPGRLVDIYGSRGERLWETRCVDVGGLVYGYGEEGVLIWERWCTPLGPAAVYAGGNHVALRESASSVVANRRLVYDDGNRWRTRMVYAYGRQHPPRSVVCSTGSPLGWSTTTRPIAASLQSNPLIYKES